uniref:Uncharacterized protein n=1 Tax=Romanomermis culicivorax TaxID=13658 RepID=A0A915JF27_ROMCU
MSGKNNIADNLIMDTNCANHAIANNTNIPGEALVRMSSSNTDKSTVVSTISISDDESDTTDGKLSLLVMAEDTDGIPTTSNSDDDDYGYDANNDQHVNDFHPYDNFQAQISQLTQNQTNLLIQNRSDSKRRLTSERMIPNEDKEKIKEIEVSEAVARWTRVHLAKTSKIAKWTRIHLVKTHKMANPPSKMEARKEKMTKFEQLVQIPHVV